MASAIQHKDSSYRPDIDGLRAVAVMMVLLHHLAPGRVTGGYIGVDYASIVVVYLFGR